MFNNNTISTRLHRAQAYMGDSELCSVVTNGVSQKPASSIVNPQDVHVGLEEGVWSYHLLCYLTDETRDLGARKGMLEKYIAAINTLSTQPSTFFVWSVDNNDNSWAPVWVRLVDRLRYFAETKPKFAGLHSELRAKVEEVYTLYKDGAKGVDARLQKHAQVDKDFALLFADPSSAELLPIIRQPVTGEVTEKHCVKFILEMPDSEKRKQMMTLYLNTLCQNNTLEIAAKLMKHVKKDVSKFSEKYTDQLPADLLQIVSDGIAAFNK